MWSWNKLQETNDFSYLFYFSKYRLLKMKADYSYKSKLISDKAYNSYISIVGLNDDFNRLLELKRDYIVNRCDWISNENYQSKMKSKFLAIDIKNLEEGIKGKGKSTVRETSMYLEKSMGIKLNLKHISVVEFFDYINFIIKNKNVA